MRIFAPSFFAVSPMILIAAVPASDTSMPFASISFAAGKLTPTDSGLAVTEAPSASSPGFSVRRQRVERRLGLGFVASLSAAAAVYLPTSALSLSRSAIADLGGRVRSAAIADWLLPAARSIF